ncbi:ABC transporter substrate-binding protein [Paenibacillus xylanexedens]|uniref:ABC transporter substrate-binding protein n=1 Tax=Paenibacillus xylanexedens TaxID=528191 RepID=UPI0011A82FC0|nr:ABC transporter substrate-binding protein [Paenibacillus xylanexedens]
MIDILKKQRMMVACLIMLVCTVLLLSACGTTADTPVKENEVAVTDTTTTNAADTENQEGDTSDQNETTKRYTDYMNRESEIPANPQRVAAVAGAGTVIDLLELGFEPVGYPYRYLDNSTILSSVHERLKVTAQDLGMPTNMEALLENNPDLIVFGYETQEREYEMLEKIAPVAAFNEDLSYAERLKVIGEIVGKQEQAEQLLNDLDQQIEAMWTNLREQGDIQEGETAAVVVYYWNKKMFLMKNFSLFDVINHPSGMPMSPEVAALLPKGSSPYIEITEEAMPSSLIADHLFMLYANNEEAVSGFEQLKNNGVYKSLPPVKNGKVHYIPLEYNNSDLITVRKLIEDFPALLRGEVTN